MTYEYIYYTSDGIQTTNDKTIAVSDSQEPIIVKLTNEDGKIFLSIID